MIGGVPIDCRTSSILGVLNNSIYEHISGSICYMDIFLDYNRNRRSIRIEKNNPIFSLAKFGFKIESKNFRQQDLPDAYEDIIQSCGIVIQHSYSTLLRRMRMIKVNLPVDIPHLVYSHQVRKVNDNLIFNTTDLRFRVMSWNHFFLNDDDEIVIYLIQKKPDVEQKKEFFIHSAREAMEVYLSTVSSQLIDDIIFHMRSDIIFERNYDSAAVWNRNVWKLYITREWYYICLQFFFPICKKSESLARLSSDYKTISDVIVENVINNKSYTLTDYIERFGELLHNEYKIVEKIYEQIKDH